MDLINLVRAELLLKMGVQRVIRVQKEEDELYERHRGTKLEKSWVRDHLPFGNMIHKIASTVNNLKRYHKVQHILDYILIYHQTCFIYYYNKCINNLQRN